MFASTRFVRRLTATLCATTLALGLAACGGEDPNAKKEPKVDPNAPVEVEFDIPQNFVEQDAYEPLTPLFDDWSARSFKLQGVENGEHEIIWVMSYVLPYDTDSMDADQLYALVDGYIRKVDNLNESGVIYPSLSNGRAGYHRYIVVPGPSGEDNIRYDSDYFFDGNKLVQIGCQKKSQDAAVLEGCNVILDTLKF